MSAPRKRTRPVGTGRRFDTAAFHLARELYGPGTRTSSGRLPQNWRDRLPDPGSYYAQHVERLSKPDATGWAHARCPFHDDRGASLRLHIESTRGHWRCSGDCGHGDLVTFHRRITGSTFVEAVRDLIGLRGGRSP